MAFLNKKERVIDLQLTSYGKKRYSEGKFEPAYYAFFDDNILYDSQYAGFVEEQNNIQHRIIKETPSIEVQTIFTGRETEVKRNNEFIRQGERNENGDFKSFNSKQIQNPFERNYALTSPIGTIRLDAEFAPAWNVNVLKGEITGTSFVKTSAKQNIKIPQINMQQTDFQILIETGLPPDINSLDNQSQPEIPETDNDFQSSTRKFEDGSFLRIFKDFLLFEISEENTNFELENFDIEIFQIESVLDPISGVIEENLIPLFFQVRTPEVLNDILLDSSEINDQLPDLNTSHVEYFFDILVDAEIDSQILINLNPTDKPEGLFGQRSIDIDEQNLNTEPSKQLYDSDVREEDLDEIC